MTGNAVWQELTWLCAGPGEVQLGVASWQLSCFPDSPSLGHQRALPGRLERRSREEGWLEGTQGGAA